MTTMLSKKKEKELIRLYPHTEDRDIAKLLSVSEWVIKRKAEELGLEKENVSGDKEQDISRWLMELYPSLSNEELSERLEIGKSEIEHRAFRMGLRKEAKYFSHITILKEERDFLDRIYENYTFSPSSNSRGNDMLRHILSELYPMFTVIPEYPIGGLRIDWFVKELKLGFEFQGIQHEQFNTFHFETKHDFIKAQNRDFEKSHLCERMGIALVHIYHDEDLSVSLVREKIKDCI